MATLEKIMQLKQQGQNDQQIIENLKQQGLSPNEINESLSQSKIKSELNDPSTMLKQTAQPQNPQFEQPPSAETTSMQPSMSQQPGTQQPSSPQQSQFTQPMQETPQSFQPPITQEIPAPEMQQQGPYPPQEYQEYQEYQPQETSIETINEIAEQIVDEKIIQLKKQITSFTKFKEELASEVLRLSERFSKIENTLNELQVAVLRKVGDYGEDIKNIAKEMHSTQDSFSKVLNPLTDNIRELQKITGSEDSKSSRPKPKTKSKKSQKPNFEDYLR